MKNTINAARPSTGQWRQAELDAQRAANVQSFYDRPPNTARVSRQAKRAIQRERSK